MACTPSLSASIGRSAPQMVKLHHALALLAPFVFVALYHHMRFATNSLSMSNTISTRARKELSRKLKSAAAVASLPGLTLNANAESIGLAAANLAVSQMPEAAKADLEKAMAEMAGDDADDDSEADAAALELEKQQQQPAATAADPADTADTGAAYAAATKKAAASQQQRDVSVDYPAPTLSSIKLLDGSPNWLPVPDAEGATPSDLAWRRKLPAACKLNASMLPGGAYKGDTDNSQLDNAALKAALKNHPLYAKLTANQLLEPVDKEFASGKPSSLPPGCACPPGRRPYHTILTAQASTYQRWQTQIFYYHFRKAQRLNPCTEMTGFTRLLASSSGGPDDLMDYMPTVTVPQLGFDKTRGFQVINRPWTMLKFLEMKEWKERIIEDYVYIAETDHLLLQDIPNRATPKVNVAFFFPYMSPVPAEQANVVKRYFDGDHLSVQPVGPSPAIVHVENLKKLTPLWYKLSVELKHDNAADRAFGWVLEMWGYSIACARVGIKHYVWQQFQIEPSSTWHQNVTIEDPFIYHYTFGVEYSQDGIPMVGAVGEWSLDKRHYFGAPPPKDLQTPPECAQECAWYGGGCSMRRRERSARCGRAKSAATQEASGRRKAAEIINRP